MNARWSPQVTWAASGPSHVAIPQPATWTLDALAQVAFHWQKASQAFSGLQHLAELPGPSICHPCCHRDSKDTWIKSPRRQSLCPMHPQGGLHPGSASQRARDHRTRKQSLPGLWPYGTLNQLKELPGVASAQLQVMTPSKPPP